MDMLRRTWSSVKQNMVSLWIIEHFLDCLMTYTERQKCQFYRKNTMNMSIHTMKNRTPIKFTWHFHNDFIIEMNVLLVFHEHPHHGLRLYTPSTPLKSLKLFFAREIKIHPTVTDLPLISNHVSSTSTPWSQKLIFRSKYHRDVHCRDTNHCLHLNRRCCLLDFWF